MAKASIPELDELHALVARTLAKKIASGEATAADINVARAFLKDNNVEALAVPGSPLGALAGTLPFPVAGADQDDQDYTSH